MTKSLEQIQQENRKFILEAIHGCSYEEALKKELGVGCKVKIKTFISSQDFNEEIFVIDDYCDFFTESFFKTIGSHHHNEIIEIIGKPLTLDRVLLGLGLKDISQPKPELEFYNGFIITINDYAWNLALGKIKITLETQSEETQRGLNEFFNN